MSDHGDRGGRNSEMKLVCCKSWGFGTHPNGGVCFRGVNPPYRSLKWHKVSFAHLWVAQATLRNQERNSHATHGSWFDRVNRDEAVVLLQTAHRKVPFSWLIQHHSLGSLLLLSRVATPKILLCCDIFSRGSAIHGRQIVATSFLPVVSNATDMLWIPTGVPGMSCGRTRLLCGTHLCEPATGAICCVGYTYKI